jgi:hypothetical protein
MIVRPLFLCAAATTACAVLMLPLWASATVGVGVGSGKIQITQQLKPGGIYEIPAVPVINTGDEQSGYSMDIEYLQGQTQFEPPQDWFSFSPGNFALEPGKVETVQIALTVPLNAKPGDYFAYIEAHPVATSTGGVTRVNIAAAAKLYFTIAPANFFEGVYYRIIGLWSRWEPWDTSTLVVLALAAMFVYLKRRVRINIGISRR